MYNINNQYGLLKARVRRNIDDRLMPLRKVIYNAENRPLSFTTADGQSRIDCDYDYQGRRYMKKVTSQGSVISHERYLYRGYLQIAALDMLNSQALIRRILWDRDPKEPSATRPLALLQDDKLYSYGHDFLKNVTELFDETNKIATTYDYSPYGAIAITETSTTNNITQPYQWSSEIADPELAFNYYNYRHYNPRDGRWINRDPIQEQGGWNLYAFVRNHPIYIMDYLGRDILPDMDCYRPVALDAYMICLVRQDWKPEPLEKCLKQCNEEYEHRSRQILWIIKQAHLANASINVNKGDIVQLMLLLSLEPINEALYAYCKKRCSNEFGFPFPNCA